MAKGLKTTTQPLKWSKAMMLLDAMRDKAGQANTRLMLACGFFFGLRISDILNLTWEQILNDDGFEVEEGKTGKTRFISLDSRFIEIRNQILELMHRPPSGFIFIYNRDGSNKNKPISVTAANKRIKKIFDEYEIKCKNPSSHTLRKTMGLRVYEVHNRCEDALILLSQIFNHGDISVTRRYIGLTEKRIANAYLSLSSGKAIYETVSEV